MKRINRVIMLVLVGGAFFMLFACVRPPSGGPNKQLDSLLSEFVKNDRSVKNCVLSVTKGDGSFSWSGAAGIAHQDGNVPMTSDTPVYIASITKLYTATIIMRLYELGALSLDDPMSKYLPEEEIHGIHVYKGRDFSREITIRQLLSHSSGIADYYSEKGKDGKSLFDLFLEDPNRQWTADQTIERARRDLTPNFPPGTATSYSDTNFQLLGKIIEAITGKPLQAAYDTLIFTPLGLKHTWLTGHAEGKTEIPADVFHNDTNITKVRSNGSYWADGGIVSTASETIVFLKALKKGQIVKPATLNQMHSWRKWHFPLDYGFGTMRFKLPGAMSALLKVQPLWGHSGSTGSFLYYSEDMDLYMAGTIDQTESQTKPFLLMIKAMKAIQSKPAATANSAAM